MMRIFRQFLFHLREFSSNTYFIQLVVVATISACLIQRLGVHVWGTNALAGFLRSFAIGLWTSCSSAAGILGFERRKGTLVFLVSSSTPALVALATVIAPIASFGLIALPLAALVWSLPGPGALPANLLITHAPQIVFGAVLLWVSAFAITLVIAAIFILTPNALAYEGLILIPVMFFSGILSPLTALTDQASGLLPVGLRLASYVLPSESAVRVLFSPVTSSLGGTPRTEQSAADLGLATTWNQWLVSIGAWSVICLVVCGLWIALAAWLGNRVLRKAREQATLEMY